jgi:hypothetical protein
MMDKGVFQPKLGASTNGILAAAAKPTLNPVAMNR